MAHVLVFLAWRTTVAVKKLFFLEYAQNSYNSKHTMWECDNQRRNLIDKGFILNFFTTHISVELKKYLSKIEKFKISRQSLIKTHF